MKRIIRLTESDLTRLVKQIIREEEEMDHQSQMAAWREEDAKKLLKPKLIEIKFLPKWDDEMSNMESGSSSGNKNIGSTVKLYADGSGQKIGTGPYDIKNDRQVFYYAYYKPYRNIITVVGYVCFGNVHREAANSDYAPEHLLNADSESYFNAKRSGESMKGLGFCKSGYGDFVSEFDSFDIGETDHRDLFEIVGTDGELQPKEDDQLSERYFRNKRRY